MKKIIVGLVVVIALFALPLFADSQIVLKGKMPTKLDTNSGLISLTWERNNENGEVVGYNGINILGLGYSSINYYSPLKTDSWNNYWHWGTAILFIPYIGVGTEYLWGNGWHAGLKTYYILPQIEFGYSW